MSIENETTSAGKIRAILLAEADPERWSAWIRIGLGVAYSFLFIYNVSAGRLLPSCIVIQSIAILFLFSYSFWYLASNNKLRFRAVTFFVLGFFDVTVITVIMASCESCPALFMMSFRNIFFCSYIITILFSALQTRRSLAAFCGFLSFAGFSYIYMSFPALYSFETGLYGYLAGEVLIVSATIVAVIISRRNYLTRSKAVSSELRYQKLVNRLPEMLFTMDMKGIFIWASKASHVLLGVPADIMPNRAIRDFMTSPESLKLDKDEFRATFQIRDFNGVLKYVDCYLQPLREENRQNLFEGIMTDVTDREIAIFQREEMVNRLYQYQKMESLGTLASGMAHDFNNILQTVSDIVTVVEGETAELVTKKRMTTISESLIDARFLISELLALGRKSPLNYKPVNLTSFFEAIIPQFQNQLGQRYTIIGKIAEKNLWIQGDADYFKRVFQNLVGNARDSMPDGGSIIIECFENKSHDKSGMVVIRVGDTGTGIPNKIKDKIFDPFFTTKKPGKGTGLGLALVQRIISLHNGTICVEKTDASGTIFRMEIPESSREDADLDTKEILLNRIKSRVLILDDDPKIRSILKFFLAEFNYPVCEASDMEEAAGELRRYVKECDLVIMDWKLGTDDPHNVIKSLRVIKPELIVIVVSGYPPRQESIKAMNICKWITKPYDKNQLDLEIQRALHSHQKSEPAPAQSQ